MFPALPLRDGINLLGSVQLRFFDFRQIGNRNALTHPAFKINLTDGTKSSLGGVGKATAIPVFYHDIRILVGADWKIGVRAGFSEELSIAGILGGTGFFDSFRVTFDHSEHPPMLELNKIEHKNVH